MMSNIAPAVTLALVVITVVWFALLGNLLLNSEPGSGGGSIDSPSSHETRQGSLLGEVRGSLGTQNEKIQLPNRYMITEDLSDGPPLDEVRKNLTIYLHTLHKNLGDMAGKHVDPMDVWEKYLETTKNLLMKWDEENKHRFPKARRDNSIFVSLGTYRDPYCPMTLKSLYSQAANPERLYIGLLQQNCFEAHCRSGVLKGGVVEDREQDMDCYKEFCNSPEGKKSNACNTGQVRLFNVNESESLGPYMARYMGAKFYRGEQYYLQIDSHSEFVSGWDHKLIYMMETAEAKKPVISCYPPDSQAHWKDTIGYRMCDSEFAAAQIEWQIIRLGTSLPFDKEVPPRPKYAPFVAAGFFFAGGDFLHEVPFDPFLPWIFMGEEISMSARLWTSGYDIFSPTTNVLNHYYVRRHYPKFWESVNRFFKRPIHNNLVELVLKRVKSMLEYPESRSELINPNSVLYRLEEWSMGTRRSFKEYMEMVGIDTLHKKVTRNMWCHNGEWPKQALQYRMGK